MGETRHIDGNEARKGNQQASGAREPWILAQRGAAPIPGALYHRRLGRQSARGRPSKGFRWSLVAKNLHLAILLLIPNRNSV